MLGLLVLVVALLPRKEAPAPVPPTPSVPVVPATSAHLAFVDGQTFVTRGHSLVSVRGANGANPSVGIDPASSRYLLAADAARHLIWVVGTSTVQAFDTATITPRTKRIALAVPSTDADVLDGALYVATDVAVVRVTVQGTSSVVGRTGAEHIAADASRHRVLTLSGRTVGVLGRPAQMLAAPASALATVAGTVWVAVGTELVQLDAVSLRPVRTVGFGSSVELAAVGRHSLLIRTGPGLSCVRADVGAIVQVWSYALNPVGFSGDGTIYTLPSGKLPAALPYGGCPG